MIPAPHFEEIRRNPYGYGPGWDRINDVPVFERIDRKREREDETVSHLPHGQFGLFAVH